MSSSLSSTISSKKGGSKKGKVTQINKKQKKIPTVKLFDPSTKKQSVLKPLFRVKRYKTKDGGSVVGSMSRIGSAGRYSPSTISDFSELQSQISSSRLTSVHPFTTYSSSMSLLKQTFSRGNLSHISDHTTSMSSITDFRKRFNPQVFDANPFGMSTTSASSVGDKEELKDLDDYGEVQPARLDDDDDESNGKKDEEIQLDENTIEEIKEQEFDITLSETKTFFLFDMFDESVSKFDKNLSEIKSKNVAFEGKKRDKIDNKEKYVERNVQTIQSFFDTIAKHKYTNTKNIKTKKRSIECNEWKMFDEYKEMREEEIRKEQEKENLQLISQMEENQEDDDYDDEEEEEENIKSQDHLLPEKEKIFTSLEFSKSLMAMERIIVQNEFFPKQNEYKIFTDCDEKGVNGEEEEGEGEEEEEEGEEEGEEEKEKGDGDDDDDGEEDDDSFVKEDKCFKSLWTFKCDLIDRQMVNCMSWNKQNKDILAVGYGNIDFMGNNSGYVLCWSIKNPVYPERKMRTDNRGVSSLDFCDDNPNLLAVGFNDGTVAIYDVRKRDNDPVLETSKNHNGTVWDLQWVDRGKDVGERLHSVGVDGRVNSWSIKKGLDCQEIMKLKKSGTAPGGIVSRDTGGLCIDFDKNDTNIYIVGSEDGTIYKCSCSYNEQYLQTFHGHSGPVNRVKWNPFNSNQFISCSADWTIKVWNQDKEDPLELTIEPYSNLVNKQTSGISDVAWNPHAAKIFGCVSINGTVELWDMNSSTLKPRLSRNTPGVKYNCLLFSETSSSVLVGDDRGNVEILKPRKLFVERGVSVKK